jgi:hypothetical protein
VRRRDHPLPDGRNQPSSWFQVAKARLTTIGNGSPLRIATAVAGWAYDVPWP